MFHMRTIMSTFLLLGTLVCYVAADVPSIVSYQGRLTGQPDQPVDTVVDMTFSIFQDSAGTTLLWTETHADVVVETGLFSVLLGSQVSFPESLFNGAIRYLGMQVDYGPMSTDLTPIVATAYAIRSIHSDTAAYAHDGPGSSSAGWIDDGTVVRLNNASDTVGVGTSTPTAKLDVAGAINTTDWYEMGGERFISDSGNGNVFVGIHAGENNTGISNTVIGYDAGVNNAGHNNTFVGRATGQLNSEGEGNTFIGVSSGSANTGGDDNTYVGYNSGIGASGSNNTYLGRSAGASASGFGNVYIGRSAGYFETGNNQLFIANSSSSTPLIFGDFEAHQVGVGTTNPTASFHAFNETGTAIKGEAGGTMINAIWGLASGSGGSGVTGTGSGLLGSGVSGFATGLHGKGVYGHSAQDSSYGVYGLSIGLASYGVFGQADGDSGIAIYGEATTSSGHAVHAVNMADSGVALYVSAHPSSGVAIEAHGGGQGFAAKFAGNVILVDRYDGTTILELGEGLDFAEGFDNADNQAIEPGTVVSIDQDNPGKLCVSLIAYDNRVAGIVAGANNLGTGVRLGGDRFDIDVALAGRVYCKVDATNAGIEPGDLLTTSATPGYAMKAVDYDRARGAILGKAMQRLKQGQKGQILVLVTLQ